MRLYVCAGRASSPPAPQLPRILLPASKPHGALAGLGAGAGIGAAVATSSDINEGPGIIVIPILGAGIAILGAVGGYLVGKSLDQPRPEFVLTP